MPPSLAAGPGACCPSRVCRSTAVAAPGVRSGRARHGPTRALGAVGGARSLLRGPSSRAGLLRRSRPPWESSVLARYGPRRARPSAHTLRVAVRAAASQGSSARTRSTGQRGRHKTPCGRHPAQAEGNRAATHRSGPQCRPDRPTGAPLPETSQASPTEATGGKSAASRQPTRPSGPRRSRQEHCRHQRPPRRRGRGQWPRPRRTSACGTPRARA